MRRTIVRCEACSGVFSGIYTNRGELIVRGWEGCPQCGEANLRDLSSAESNPLGGVAGSERERIDGADRPGERTVDGGDRGRIEDRERIEEPGRIEDGRAGERSAGRTDERSTGPTDERSTRWAGD